MGNLRNGMAQGFDPDGASVISYIKNCSLKLRIVPSVMGPFGNLCQKLADFNFLVEPAHGVQASRPAAAADDGRTPGKNLSVRCKDFSVRARNSRHKAVGNVEHGVLFRRGTGVIIQDYRLGILFDAGNDFRQKGIGIAQMDAAIA